MADNHTLARPYAQAAFDVAQQEAALQELSDSLDVARELLADGQVVAFLANPGLSDERRLEFLQGLFADAAGKDSIFAGGSQHGTNFLKLLLEYGRVNVLPEIAERFDELKARVENTIDVTVISAIALSESQKKTIADALHVRLGREIRIETEIDEDLLGGAIIRAGDIVIDGSLRSSLQGLSNALVA